MGLTIRRKASEDEHGFTLIELLVVILVIGILAAIAVPALLNQRKASVDAVLKSDLKTMATALETWQVSSGKTFSDIPAAEGKNAWSIVVRHSPDTPFMGSVGDASFTHEGFEPPHLSEGVAVGVVTRPSMQANGGGGYCIAGNAQGSNYEVGPVGSTKKFSSALYYDSLSGGIYSPQELPGDGACRYHQGLINPSS